MRRTDAAFLLVVVIVIVVGDVNGDVAGRAGIDPESKRSILEYGD